MSKQDRSPPAGPELGPSAAPQCAACGTPATVDQRFCGCCGAKLAAACPACGNRNPPANRFCGACGIQLSTAGSGAPTAPAATTQVAREERRWATILFADLSNFTSIAELLDPEEVKTLAHRCVQQLCDEVRRFGGTVVGIAGDQVMAAFGAPMAHEDDAERAVRAGLAMRDCLLKDESGRPITVHLGINTGHVMAGLMGPEEHRDYTVMGDTTNTAARLMSAAPAGSVLVGEETWRATRGTIQYRDLPPVLAKGKQQPVAVWEALGVIAAPKTRAFGTAALVGRDEELRLLSSIWLRVVRDAQPHLVTLLGDPGIGKSRLVSEFEKRCCGEARLIHGRCLPYGEAIGYWAVNTALREAAGITAEADACSARAQLFSLVSEVLPARSAGPAEISGVEEVTGHLALLGGLDTELDRRARSPDQRALHGSFFRFVQALAARKPLCWMIEDLHWADDALLDLIEYVASHAHSGALLILTQARPQLLEKRPAWGRGAQGFSSLTLRSLNEVAARELVVALCQERGLSEAVSEQVGRGAGGNPLFAEELVAMIAERGVETGVPSAITALISARLDSLPVAERTTLQLAAVLGKCCWLGSLISLGAPEGLTEHLEALERKDLLRAQPVSQFHGEPEFAFKHDLIRDTAYDALPRSVRKKLHGRVLAWMEEAAGEHVVNYLDQLAYHALQAGEDDLALGYLVRAAERAGRTSAHHQEAALLGQAIEIAVRSGQSALVGELHGKRGRALIKVANWAEALSHLEPALQSLGTKEDEQRVLLLLDISTAAVWLGDSFRRGPAAREALRLAESLKREDLASAALAVLAVSTHNESRFAEARDQFRQAHLRGGGMRATMQAYAPHSSYVLGEYVEGMAIAQEAIRSFEQSNDSTAMMLALSHLGLNLSAVGRYGEAASRFDEARRLGQQRELRPLLARAISMSSGLHLDAHDFAGAEKLAQEALDLAWTAKFQAAEVSSRLDLLLNFIRRGDVGRAEPMLKLFEAENWEGKSHEIIWRIRLAQARAEFAVARGDYPLAVREAEATIQESEARGRMKYQVLGRWARARALDGLGRKHEAILDLRRAVELARQLGDPALLLRVAGALLGMNGDDALKAETLATARRIAQALPSEPMRLSFERGAGLGRIATE